MTKKELKKLPAGFPKNFPSKERMHTWFDSELREYNSHHSCFALYEWIIKELSNEPTRTKRETT